MNTYLGLTKKIFAFFVHLLKTLGKFSVFAIMNTMNGINKPQTKRGQKSFDNLINAATVLFHTKGYHQTGVAEIALEAGVSVGTFYIYFSDKYSLYRYILFELGNVIRTHTARAASEAKSRGEEERLGIKAFIKFIRDFPYAYTVIWQSLQVDKALFIEYYTDFARRYVKGLQVAEQNGEVSDVDLTTLSYALMGISNFVGLQVTMLEPNLKSDETIDRLVDNLFDAFEKGLFVKKS